MLKEYLYIDSKRLDMYYEQFGASVIYDKVAEVGGGLGLTGPKVTTTQKRPSRLPNKAEKIEALISKLKKDECLTEQRPSKEQRTFVLESCNATRFIVPSSNKDAAKTRDIAIWVSPPERTPMTSELQPGLLCLFEAYQGNDNDGTPFDSEFSLFMSLIYALHQDGRKILLLEHLGINDKKISFTDTWRKSEEHIEAFHQDPEGTLRKLGCRPSLSRRLEVMYRVREIRNDLATNYKTASVFGYPIYIAAE